MTSALKKSINNRKGVGAWAREISEVSSIHGVGWYNRINNCYLKTIVLVLSLLAMISLPVYIGIQYMEFQNNKPAITSTKWNRSINENYPNITVCHSRYFDARKLRALNISDDLANYMTMSLDMTFPDFYKFMTTDLPYTNDLYKSSMDRLAVELDEVLAKQNMNMKELMTKAAIGCDDFIIFCEDHRKFFLSPSLSGQQNATSCCGLFFYPNPIFTNVGTCFTTKAEIKEVSPLALSNFRVWMDYNEKITPEFKILWKGADALDRHGVFYTISHRDAPGSQVVTNPIKLEPGTSTIVGLSKRVSDRHGLALVEGDCLSPNQTFTELYGVEYTKANCESLFLHYAFNGCSIAAYYGLKELPNLPPCKPQDLLRTKNYGNFSSIAMKSPKCAYDCRRVDYDVSVSSTKQVSSATQTYIDELKTLTNISLDLDERTKDITAVMFYFKSFDYPITTIYQESFFDFISKAGGTMGLVVGASILSFVEIIYFFLSLLQILMKSLIVKIKK